MIVPLTTMSTVLLFCTANVDPKVIDNFVTQSNRPRSSGPKQWVLVRSTSGPVTGPYLSRAHELWPKLFPRTKDSPPIEPFETGFLDASVDKLQNFVRHHSLDETDRKDFDTSHGMFAVLDARSAKDGTVLLYQHHSRMPREALEEDEDAYDRKLLIHEWVEWRLKFLTAGFWAGTYAQEPDYADFEEGKGTYIDGEGVLQIPYLEHGEYEVPGLDDDEKVPWGPEDNEVEWKFPESAFVDLVDAGKIKVYPVDWKPKD